MTNHPARRNQILPQTTSANPIVNSRIRALENRDLVLRTAVQLESARTATKLQNWFKATDCAKRELLRSQAASDAYVQLFPESINSIAAIGKVEEMGTMRILNELADRLNDL